jgi:hypothetical protein
MTNSITYLKEQRDAAREACNKASEVYAIAADEYATAKESHLTWHVTTDHVAPEYCTDETWTVDESHGEPGYFVNNRYGCSRTESTPEKTIRNMMLQWGMTNIRIVAV